jgi:GGDEF domain-containing protein
MRTATAYQAIVELLSNVLEAFTVAFFVVDRPRRQFHLTASHSLSKHLKEHTLLPLDESGLLTQVYRSVQPIHVEKIAFGDIEAALPFYRGGEALIKGLFLLPVGTDAGLLYVDTKYAWGFNDKQRKWIAEVAGLLHQFVKHDECLMREHHYARILELWHHLDQMAFSDFQPECFFQVLVDAGSRFLNVDYGFLALMEPHGDHYRLIAATSNIGQSFREEPFPADRGLLGWIFENRKNLMIPRLKAQSPEHFLFFPREKFPHQGTFWGLYREIPTGHATVLAFLARQARSWTTDDHYAIERTARFAALMVEKLTLSQACERLRNRDAVTGSYNALAFETILEEQVIEALNETAPFTLALLHIEPWEELYLRHAPPQIRRYRLDLTAHLEALFPSPAIIGQVAENRVALLFPRALPRAVEPSLLRLADLWRHGALRLTEDLPLELHSAVVSFPQDANTVEELWGLLYKRLYSAAEEPGGRLPAGA